MHTDTPLTLVAAGYSTLERARQDHGAVWGARGVGSFHHSCVAVLAQRPGGRVWIDRVDNTAEHLEWGPALLGGALFVLLPRVGARMMPTVELTGGSAFIRHFHRQVGLTDLVAAAGLLDTSAFGLVVVMVNRARAEVEPLLAHAAQVHAVDTVWGELEEELRWDLARPRIELVLLPG